MEIRTIKQDELSDLLHLYMYLHGNDFPLKSEQLDSLWQAILKDTRQSIIVLYEQERLVSSCVVTIIRNLTHNQRPYALVENVITHPDYRKKGYGGEVLRKAKEIALEHHCYKIMLMTGSKSPDTYNFYRRAGFNSEDKKAFIQWL